MKCAMITLMVFDCLGFFLGLIQLGGLFTFAETYPHAGIWLVVLALVARICEGFRIGLTYLWLKSTDTSKDRLNLIKAMQLQVIQNGISCIILFLIMATSSLEEFGK